MSKKLISSSILTAIADFIRSKKGTQDTYKPTEFVEEINEVYDDKQPVLQTKSATPTTSTQVIEADNGYDGLDKVTVNPYTLSPTIQVSPSENDVEVVPETYGTNGISKVIVKGARLETIVYQLLNQDTELVPQQGYLGFKKITIKAMANIPLTVNPTTSSQHLVPSAGYVYSDITVNPVTSAIDSNINAGNIRDGITILGVLGTYTGSTPQNITTFNALAIANVTEFIAEDFLGMQEISDNIMYNFFTLNMYKNSSNQWVTKLQYITLPSTITHICNYNFDMTIYESNASNRGFHTFSQYQLYYDGTQVQYANIQMDYTSLQYRNIPTRYASAFYIQDVNGNVTRNGKTYSLLKNINISGTNVTIKHSTFTQMPNELNSITIGSGVVAIEDYAFHRTYFEYNSSLQNKILINSSGLTIGKGAFACGIPVNDPENNRHFGSFAYNNVNIIEIVDCASIGDYAFANFKTLTRIIIRKTDAVITAGTEIFYGWDIPETMSYDDFHIYVPAALVDSYKAASGWSTYASYITALPSNM